jgi:hypothetical protein
MVAGIVNWVRHRYGEDPGLCVFRDAPDAPLGSRPPPIAGFIPDVLARTVPASFVTVGEAKWYRDLESQRSTRQLRAFLEYLSLQVQPELVLATPWSLAGRARAVAHRAARTTGTAHVPVVFLHF